MAASRAAHCAAASWSNTLWMIGDKLSLQGGFWDFVGSPNDNLDSIGFAIIGIFIAA